MLRHKSSKGPNTSLCATHCSFPVQFDVYWGCSHQCKYCFANTRGGFVSGEKRSDCASEVMRYGTVKQLADYIAGKRSRAERWCDWRIPIKFGTNSDAFQPCELKERATLKCLKLFAKTGYPFIVITKGTNIATRPEYLAVLKDCNVLMHISMCCSMMDRLERGAPKYEDRLRHLEILSKTVPRTVARWQPFFGEFLPQAIREVRRVKDAGAYGILVQSAYLSKPTKNCRYRLGDSGKFFYAHETIRDWTKKIKRECHKHNLVFLSSDIYTETDEYPCCGVKGLEGFEPCRCNSIYKILCPEKYHATPRMKEKGTAEALLNYARRFHTYDIIRTMSFEDIIREHSEMPDIIEMVERR